MKHITTIECDIPYIQNTAIVMIGVLSISTFMADKPLKSGVNPTAEDYKPEKEIRTTATCELFTSESLKLAQPVKVVNLNIDLSGIDAEAVGKLLQGVASECAQAVADMSKNITEATKEAEIKGAKQ